MKIPSAVRAFRVRPVSAAAVLIALAAVGHAFVVGCGGKSEQSNTEQTSTGGTQATPPPSSTPPVADAGDLGARVYAQRCVLCHGNEGKGDGPASAGLNPKPRNHTDGSYMNTRTNDDLLTVIRNGKGSMPAWGSVLSDEEIQAVLKHIRTLAQPPYPGPQ